MHIHACIMYLESEGYMMNRKYFFFDIDGTLAVGTPGDQYIPESTQYALKQLEAEGHFIAIATGRSYAMAHDYMHELGFHNMISDGGNGMTIENTIMMGDSGNDIEAFQSAGKAIAMGNATEEIKKLATEITLDNDHDGIKVIVDKYLL